MHDDVPVRFMKQTVMKISAAIMLMMGGFQRHIRGSAEKEIDGINVTVAAEVDYNDKTESHIIHLTSVIANHSNVSIMNVSYKVQFMDRSGAVRCTVNPTWNGQDTPLKPGESITHEYGFQDKFYGNDPVSIRVTITEVLTEEDLPPVHLPLAGEFWYQAINDVYINRIQEDRPVRIQFYIDHMGAREEADITDPEVIDEILGAFLDVRIAQESYTFVTDNYNGILFTFADGTESWISLNLTTYEMFAYRQAHYYDLDHFEALWLLMNEYADFPS